MKDEELEGQPVAQMEDIYSSNKTVCTHTHTHTHNYKYSGANVFAR